MFSYLGVAVAQFGALIQQKILSGNDHAVCMIELSAFFYETFQQKGGNIMAEKVKSKTDVAARAESKGRAQVCKLCGNKVDVVLAVSPSGKKRVKRLCCSE